MESPLRPAAPQLMPQRSGFPATDTCRNDQLRSETRLISTRAVRPVHYSETHAVCPLLGIANIHGVRLVIEGPL